MAGEMASWYLYSIAALLLLGIQRFLYKVAAERDCSSALTTAVFMGTVTLLSGVAFLVTAAPLANPSLLMLLALINSISFAGTTLAHIEALRHLPAGITFPLTRLSLGAVVVVSVGFFDERLSHWQWLGVMLGVAVVALLARDARGELRPAGNRRSGFLLVAICVVCGTIAAVSSKVAAVSTSISGFMAMSYLFGTGFSVVIETKWGRGKKTGPGKEAVAIGVVMGILNYAGFSAFMLALRNGPLSAIALITGMHFMIAIALSILLYKERLTLTRSVGIVLTLLSVVLLRS
jgi:drug/metabolite transporter (DMT)-like permease